MGADARAGSQVMRQVAVTSRACAVRSVLVLAPFHPLFEPAASLPQRFPGTWQRQEVPAARAHHLCLPTEAAVWVVAVLWQFSAVLKM